MIVALRLDDRLIHGQTGMMWTKELKVDGIVVANDTVANDKTQQMALKMATPNNVKVIIKSVNDAITLLENPKAKNMRILLLVNNLDDALALTQKLPEIEYVNLGNYGRMVQSEKKRISILPEMRITIDDYQKIQQLESLNAKTYFQMLPDDKKTKLADLVKESDFKEE
ncbi:PTS sugar transporter subunit IIB [Enterococcus sp. HY326]|uniref:PTS sugar transporter subunit IIB n=1 Tax=Enterococcus sp. HY326 TaxID=2971265 RepID=UPI00223FCA66|nr:PTS sugar transporter subunit IIB [Enterococcus sp. HY326]